MESKPDVIFQNQVPLTIKSVQDSLLTEKRHSGVTVFVSSKPVQGGRFKILDIRLTDESDPYFLYSLQITEDDFLGLKQEQNLLIDFLQFPHKFVELLEACVQATEPQPKFVCQLLSEPQSKFATLSIVETNSFKHINHLSLYFTPGNDATVKEYLAHVVKELKLENQSLADQLAKTGSRLTSKISDDESIIQRLTQELDQMKLGHSESMSSLKLEHAKQMAYERERFVQEKDAKQRQFEDEKREYTRKHDLEIHALSEKLATLNATHAHTTQHLQTLEQSLASANKQSESLSKEIGVLRQDLERTKTMNLQLEQTKQDLEANVFSLRQDLRSSERREREALDAKQELESKFKSALEQKSTSVESLEYFKHQNASLDERLRLAQEEINKGNEIIRRLQTDLKATKSKLKLKNVVAMQQEKLLDERQAAQEAQQKEINNLKESLLKETESNNSLRQKMDEVKAKLEESKAVIEDNNHVIEWLHKQLNEEAVGRPGQRQSFGIDFDRYATVPERVSPHQYRSRYVPVEVSENSPNAEHYSLRPPNVRQSPPKGRMTPQPSPKPLGEQNFNIAVSPSVNKQFTNSKMATSSSLPGTTQIPTSKGNNQPYIKSSYFG
ncbi:hypothetical protein EDD86DRAFT_205347, partial [Gorgonomyces haynaldii]